MLIWNNYNITNSSKNRFKLEFFRFKLYKKLVNRKYIKYSISTVKRLKPKKTIFYYFSLRQTSMFTLLQFDFHFLKKEKLYTKLKYSRSPQYDIVSGGVAALFSAFIGFLISEKFGIELVDSGDFYILFMYLVFGVFSIRPLVKLITKFNKNTPVISVLPLLNIVNLCFIFVFNKINFIIKSITNY